MKLEKLKNTAILNQPKGAYTVRLDKGVALEVQDNDGCTICYICNDFIIPWKPIRIANQLLDIDVISRAMDIVKKIGALKESLGNIYWG